MPDPAFDVTGPTIYEPEDANGLQWRIPSRSHPNRDGDQFVDLRAYGGRGKCTCMDWTARVGPAVKKGAWLDCYHIRVAHERRKWWRLFRDIAEDPNRQHDLDEGVLP